MGLKNQTFYFFHNANINMKELFVFKILRLYFGSPDLKVR